ncbi:MAG: hypothetical protein OEW42_08620 [Acidimicrobiia bacterium]|nr:hypothetical protein [Acidimicrobiia bacterium]
MTDPRRFRLLRLVAAAAAAATLMLGLAPAASSDDGTDEPATSSRAAAADGIDGRAVIPGFYPVGSRPFVNSPLGLELDPGTGHLWASENSQVLIYDHAGNVVDSFGSAGSGDGQFNGANGIAISDGEAFIADYVNDRVQVFDTDGNHLRNISGGGLDNPCAVEVIGDRVFISGEVTDDVRIFTKNGSFIDTFNGSDSGTAINPGCNTDFLTTSGGELFLGDWFNNRVPVFDTDGNWLRTIATGGNPAAIDADAMGNLFIADFAGDEVSIWTTAGAFVGAFDTSGSALGELNNPQAIVADPSGSTFWVGEQTNNRFQIFTSLDCNGEMLTQVGTSYSDTFEGTSGGDTVNLGKGFDSYGGRGGNDTICGGSGQDDLSGGVGDDLILGGNGNDTMSGNGGADYLDGKQGFDLILGGGGDDFLTGSNGFDDLKGGGGDDLLRGATGNDTVNGNAGRDEVNGGQGRDDARGGGGDDTVAGQNGDDKLSGGTGTDDCKGGNGIDTANTCEFVSGVP